MKPGIFFYGFANYLDLRHSTPSTDEDFKHRFAKDLKITLSKINSELADYLEPDENASIYELLDLVFEELDGKRDRLLVILDGFDHIIKETGITRNLWDQLRNLAQHNSLRLVTGSRLHLRSLRGLMPSDSRVSDFWEIFNPTPLPVGKLDDYIREVADFGQHTTPRDKVTIGIAAAYCLSAISLCESLKNDLPST